MERAAALRDLKLLVGSGGFDFTKGMDSLDKHVEQIPSVRHILRTWVAERLAAPDLHPSPGFVDVLLQSDTYDGYMTARGDRPLSDA